MMVALIVVAVVLVSVCWWLMKLVQAYKEYIDDLHAKALIMNRELKLAPISERHLRLAENALIWWQARYDKDIAYWKTKDKASRKRAWEAEQADLPQTARLTVGTWETVSCRAIPNDSTGPSITIAELAEKEKE